MLETVWLSDGAAEYLSKLLTVKDFDKLNSASVSLREVTRQFTTDTCGPGLVDCQTGPLYFIIENPVSSRLFEQTSLFRGRGTINRYGLRR